MLGRLRRQPLLVGAAEVLADAARYIAVMMALLILLGQLVKLAAGGS